MERLVVKNFGPLKDIDIELNRINLSENKRTFRINNKLVLTINKVTVDGCYITSGLKCDYLFEIINKEIKQVFYIVASRVPKSSTSSQKLKKEFKRKNSIPLFIDTKTKEVKV